MTQNNSRVASSTIAYTLCVNMLKKALLTMGDATKISKSKLSTIAAEEFFKAVQNKAAKQDQGL